MTWHSAQDATNVFDCDVPLCTGIAFTKGGRCQWHIEHGGPEQYGNPRQPAAPGSVDQLQDRVDELDRQIGRLMEERRRVYRRLTQAEEAA